MVDLLHVDGRCSEDSLGVLAIENAQEFLSKKKEDCEKHTKQESAVIVMTHTKFALVFGCQGWMIALTNSINDLKQNKNIENQR